jgi:hypothetical protein
MTEHAVNIEPVQVREFKSSIPPHLLGKLSESERYMVETMSKLENQSDWLVGIAVENRKTIMAIDAGVTETKGMTKRVGDLEALLTTQPDGLRDKVSKLWDWKTMMSGKWAVLWALLLIVFSVGLKYIMDLWTKKGP